MLTLVGFASDEVKPDGVDVQLYCGVGNPDKRMLSIAQASFALLLSIVTRTRTCVALSGRLIVKLLYPSVVRFPPAVGAYAVGVLLPS